jgi:hypothetical protein
MSPRKSSAALLDSVVVNHRRIADQLEERLYSIQGAPPVKADHRPRRTAVNVSLPTETPDHFESPESSTIERAECVEGVLKVVFKRKASERSPKIYTCSEFPSDLWREWTQAPSKGGFFAQRVRPNFSLKAL